MPAALSELELRKIHDGAREMWSLWIAFFDALDGAFDDQGDGHGRKPEQAQA
jgi:hypothetical protein